MKTLSLSFLVLGLISLVIAYIISLGKCPAPAPIPTRPGLSAQAEKCLSLEVTDSCRMGDSLFVKVARLNRD